MSATSAAHKFVSIQLLSPTSGELLAEINDTLESVVFPFNCFPQRVGRQTSATHVDIDTRMFPFNCFPQRVGSCSL